MPQRYIMATKTDWTPGLEAFEGLFKVKYVIRKFYHGTNAQEFGSFHDIPNFGYERASDIIGGERYLVLPRDVSVQYHKVNMADGSIQYLVKQEDNPLATKFQPGGWYNADCLIGGEVAVYSWSPTDEPFYKNFVRTVTKGFVGIHDWQKRRFWCGPEAMQALREGKRLVAGSVSAPDTYEDIHLPENMK